MAQPTVVFRTYSDIEASIVKGLLDVHGIEAGLSSDVPHSVFPVTVNGLGEVRVSVSSDQAEAATRLIRDYQDPGDQARAVRIRDEFEALEESIGHRFRDRGTLEHALTHRSRANEDVTGGVADNESLEFLGDALLGFVITEVLFARFPDRDEGQKSKMKGALVSTSTLARQAERLGLGEHLLLGRGEEKSGGRRKQALLADGYEAVIAALYLDGGIDAARSFIVREFELLITEVAGAITIGDDHKSALQEALQGRGDPLPEYVVTAEDGPAHRRVFRIDVRVHGRVLATGRGLSKKEAEQDGARMALGRISRE
jgi:ribonuclease-3